MAEEANELDPFVNTEEVGIDNEEMRILDERCREIDEGRVRMVPSDEIPQLMSEWLSKFSTQKPR